MPKRTRKYEDSLNESLKDPKEAAAYLNTHLDDKEEDSEGVFLMALRDVAKAYGLTSIAEGTKLNRQSLYRALSETGNPELATLIALLKVMGLRLSVEVMDKAS